MSCTHLSHREIIMSHLEKQLRDDKAKRMALLATADAERAKHLVTGIEVLNRLITIEAKGTL